MLSICQNFHLAYSSLLSMTKNILKTSSAFFKNKNIYIISTDSDTCCDFLLNVMYNTTCGFLACIYCVFSMQVALWRYKEKSKRSLCRLLPVFLFPVAGFDKDLARVALGIRLAMPVLDTELVILLGGIILAFAEFMKVTGVPTLGSVTPVKQKSVNALKFKHRAWDAITLPS